MKASLLKKLFVAALLVTGANASADGFVCESDEGDLNIRVYNYVNPEDGTRTASNMIVSDPSIGAGRKTIATFTYDNGTLSQDHESYAGLMFYGIVDLRFSETGRKGEYLLGTRLGEVEYIQLYVAHNYSEPLTNGDAVGAQIAVMKRDGEWITRQATCTRYLKGE